MLVYGVLRPHYSNAVIFICIHFFKEITFSGKERVNKDKNIFLKDLSTLLNSGSLINILNSI